MLRSSGGPQVILSEDLVGCYGTLFLPCLSLLYLAFGHITLSTPLLIYFAKFRSVGSSQYLDGCPPGYTRGCRLSLCGLLEEEFVLSCSLAVSGFPTFSKTVAACGNFLVVSSTVLLPVGVRLCSCSSQLSFSFAANVCWGPGGILPLGPLLVFIHFLRRSGSLWVSLSFVSPRSLLDFLKKCCFVFFKWDWDCRAVVFLPYMSVLFEEF